MGSLDSFVRSAPRLFVLTGAGCSTASGIPDYRDEKGEWKHKPPVQFQDFVGSFATRRGLFFQATERRCGALGWEEGASR